MALSLNEIHAKQKKARKGKAQAKPRQRSTRPWEGTMNDTSENEKTHTRRKHTKAASPFLRQVLKDAFAYKDKLVTSKWVKSSWNNATHRMQAVLDKNPILHKSLADLNVRLGVTDKVCQTLRIAKTIEQEIRQKL